LLPGEAVEIDMVLDGKFASFEFLHELMVETPDRSFDVLVAEGDVEVDGAPDQSPEMTDDLAPIIRDWNGRPGPESTGPNSLPRLIEERLNPCHGFNKVILFGIIPGRTSARLNLGLSLLFALAFISFADLAPFTRVRSRMPGAGSTRPNSISQLMGERLNP
jgi:hypothetical protein